LALARKRTGRTTQDVAVAARLSVDTVRGLENGRVPTPAFFTVARMAVVLGLSLDDLHRQAQEPRRARAGGRAGVKP
jgi:transcriptional regulator with XRE-family HTH domain